MPPQVVVDHLTGFEKHDLFDDDDEEEDEEEEDDDDDEDDEDEEDVRHFGDDGFEDEYGEEDNEDSWTDLGEDIRPEESASRSRGGPSRSRPFPPVRDPPRHKARGKYPAVVDPPSGPPPPGHRGGRSRSSRPPRPRSVADNLDQDEYLFGRTGQLPFHPAPQWAGVGIGYTGGHAHTAASGTDPFSPYGGANPANPFADDYFPSTRRNGYRNMMVPRNNELMPFNPAFPAYPAFGPYPPFPPYGYPYGHPGTSPVPPPSNKSTPAPPPPPAAAPPPPPPPPPKEEPADDPRFKAIHQMLLDQKKREQDRIDEEIKAKADAKRQAEEDKLDALQKLILKHNIEQLEREKKQAEKAQKEADDKAAAAKAAADAKKAADEKQKELVEAAKKAKEDAEKEAQKKAAEEKEKFEKQLEEQKKKAADLEAAKKKVEEENKKLKPGDDMLKPPIKFKDAVGRKFSFPWHLCKTWKGMKSLIEQAFLYVEPIGQHVHDGHYDLIGPDGEIILPQVWETMVKPDWSITMQMWPLPEPKLPPEPPPMPPPMVMPVPFDPPPGGKHHKHKKGKDKGKGHMGPLPAPPMGPPPPPGMMPPPPPPPPGMAPPPPGMAPPPPGAAPPPPGMGPAPTALGPDGQAPMAMPYRPKKKRKEPAPLALWFAGGPVSKKDSLKYEKEIESGPWLMKSSSGRNGRPASIVEMVPSAENGVPMRPSAPNGKPVKKGWFR